MKYYAKLKLTGLPFLILILLPVALSSLLFSGCGNKVKPDITIEAGSPVPDITEFFISPKTTGKFITDISAIDTKKVGATQIELESGGKFFTSLLIVEDTSPPSGKPAELYIFKGRQFNPEDLVTDIKDETEVTLTFASGIDLYKPGWQDITITLTDRGNNSTDIESRIYIFDVIGEVIFEAGEEPVLAVQDFVSNYTEDAALSFSSVEKIDFLSPGIYPVTLTSGNYTAESNVRIQDTTPPAGSPAELYIFKGNEIAPEDLVTGIEDATQVICTFASPPDLNKPGWHDITVILSDEGNNSVNIGSKLYILDATDELTFESGTARNISEINFIRNYSNVAIPDLTFTRIDEIDFFTPGNYAVILKSGNYDFPASVKIQDTTPPAANVKNLRTYKGNPVPADNFAYDVKDVSPVTVRYKSAPDFSAEGKQTVYIILEDAYKNISEYKTSLTVVTDTTPPVISGGLHKRVALGGSVSYRSGVTVADDYDSNVQLAIDGGAVNLNKTGTYEVVYSAADESGNKTEVKGSVTVYDIDVDFVNDMADEILSKIAAGNMDIRSKAKAIYDWIHNKMKYSASLSPREVTQGAYNCFTRGAGDCYTYAAASHVLLTRAGIDSVIISRIAGAERPHYWNLVDLGEGWHHFDVCPTPGNAVTIEQRFMFTESQAQKYTRAIKTSYPYYEYDKSTAPETAK